MFANCFPNTLDTTVHYGEDADGNPDTYRDSNPDAYRDSNTGSYRNGNTNPYTRSG